MGLRISIINGDEEIFNFKTNPFLWCTLLNLLYDKLLILMIIFPKRKYTIFENDTLMAARITNNFSKTCKMIFYGMIEMHSKTVQMKK